MTLSTVQLSSRCDVLIAANIASSCSSQAEMRGGATKGHHTHSFLTPNHWNFRYFLPEAVNMLQCAKLTELPLKKIIPFRLNYGHKKKALKR